MTEPAGGSRPVSASLHVWYSADFAAVVQRLGSYLDAGDRRQVPRPSGSRGGRADEATSALDAANETVLYEQVAAAKIDVVSVRTRAGLLECHDVLLELLGDGKWRISRLGSSRPPAG